jgi:hypothetical protein
VALDLLLALIVTSLVRTRLPLRLWRGVHLASYALWPVALAHGWGIGGSDSALSWVLVLEGCCVAAVVVALVLRLRASHPDAQVRR